MTLEEYLSTGEVDDLAEVVLAVANACRELSDIVRGAAANDLLGALATGNAQGEVQKRLDVVANDVILNALRDVDAVAGAASEEMDTAVPLRLTSSACRRLVLFDPLDGSSNVDVNVSIGTIFSILTVMDSDNARMVTDADFLQRGRAQAAAGYAIYGPQTSLVLTLGRGVVMFSLDPGSGSWIQTNSAVATTQSTNEFAINTSNERYWARPVRVYVCDCVAGAEGRRGKNFNMRWVGSMVADVHRIMMRGGVFLYPWDRRDPLRPGKLRLLYEGNPMAFLVEQAGGAAFDGRVAILDVTPLSLHQRTSIMLGAAEEIDILKALHA